MKAVEAHETTGSFIVRPFGDDFTVFSIWDDQEIICEVEGKEAAYVTPTVEEWKILAGIVQANIEALTDPPDLGVDDLGDTVVYATTKEPEW